MAKVTIELSDSEEEGGVNCRVEFDPPVSTKDDEEVTVAQYEGAFLVEIMQRRASGQPLSQIAEEMEDDSLAVGGLEIEATKPEGNN